MIRRSIYTIAMLGLLTVAGCANFGPTKYLAPSMGESGAGKHEVSVERDTHFGYNSVPFVVFVDGKEVAQVLGGEVINLYVPDGRRIIGISAAPNKKKPDMSVAVDVSATSKPVIHASMCAIGYCGAKIELVSQ